MSGALVQSALLLGNTESLSCSSGGFRVLTSDLESPEVAKASVVANLFHAFQIFSESGVNDV